MIKKILCSIDDTDHSRAAVDLAVEMAQAFGAELTLVAVNELMGAVGRTGAASYLWEDEELKLILDRAVEQAKAAGMTELKTSGLKSRDVARAITMFAEEISADHIVVGTGGKGSISRLMLGSVSRDVVFRAHCPVTVAR
ncbi:MAG: universal stress protein [Hyphomicrobium sp.]|nr:universal stress protein [Hyphomicrobium sp.]